MLASQIYQSLSYITKRFELINNKENLRLLCNFL